MFFGFKHRFYDDLSRLIEADYNDGANVYNYGYDLAGNIVDYDGVTRTYNAANQMTNDGTNTLTYDYNGNLTGNGADTYTWDSANRLLSVGNHSYVYDGVGNRVQQTVFSVVTDYLNDVQPGLTKLLAQSTVSNLDRFVHGVRGIHAVDDGTDWNFYAQDGLGSVRAVVDDSAVVQSSMSFDPYGNPKDAYGAGFGFTGEQTDADGSVFLRARYYEPSLGTFIKRDPAETPNRYGYVSGNPINLVDPSGLMPVGYGAASSGSSINGIRTNIKWNPIYWNLENPLVIQSMNSGLCDDGGSVAGGNKRRYRRGSSNVQQGGTATPTSTPTPMLAILADTPIGVIGNDHDKSVCQEFEGLTGNFGDAVRACENYFDFYSILGRELTYQELMTILIYTEFLTLFQQYSRSPRRVTQFDADFDRDVNSEAIEALTRQYYELAGQDGVFDDYEELFFFLGGIQGWYDQSVNTVATIGGNQFIPLYWVYYAAVNEGELPPEAVNDTRFNYQKLIASQSAMSAFNRAGSIFNPSTWSGELNLGYGTCGQPALWGNVTSNDTRAYITRVDTPGFKEGDDYPYFIIQPPVGCSQEEVDALTSE